MATVKKVQLLNLTGYDAWEIMLQQHIITRGQFSVEVDLAPEINPTIIDEDRQRFCQ